MGILYTEQQEISDNIYNRLDHKELYNIPTGRGKTYILLDVALRVARERKEKVIISVPNNYLAREMCDIATKVFSIDKKDVGIKIANSNYIDRAKFILASENGTLESYCEESTLDKYIEKHFDVDEHLFFDDFEDMVHFKDVGLSSTLKRLLTLDNSGDVPLFKNITITNHFYLLSKSIYSKNFNIGEYCVLVDEVHQLSDVADSVFSHAFSFYEYKNVLSFITKEIKKKNDFHGKLKILKTLGSQTAKASKALNRFTNKELTGKYVYNREENKEIMEYASSLLSTTHHKYIDKYLSKNDEVFYKKFTGYSEARNSFKNKDFMSYGVFYSPSLGYPVINSSTANPLGQINALFWKKITSFAGVSGSVTSSFTPDTKEVNYGYSRLGMVEKGENRKIHSYDRTFPIENVNIYTTPSDFYDGIDKESVFDEDFNEEGSEYYEKIIDFIHKNHQNKNSIVICGGYKECEYLSRRYKNKYDDVKIHHSNSKESVKETLMGFTEYGGILFATQNYGTGVSLEGELLENLFILKYPYPNFTSKKWQSIKVESVGKFSLYLEREMLITLMQYMGRVGRTKCDKGNIYLLDYRYNSKGESLKKKVIEIINKYGVILEKKEKKREKKDLKKLFF